MDKLSKVKNKPAKVLAVELFALQPAITIEEVAKKVGATKSMVSGWRSDPNFLDACYDRYMIEFGSQLPSVLNAMVREAQAGNVQAGRLVLEHSGKLVKNINVTVDSPFEKFMKKIEVAEVVDGEIEDVVVTEIINEIPEEVIEATPLPERKVENQGKRAAKEKRQVKKAVKTEKQKAKYLNQRKKWYRWKKRAEAVGVKPLSAKRPTKGQRVAWQEEIVEKELNG